TNGDYRDDNVYKYADPILAWETALGIIPGTNVAAPGTLRRKYVNLQFITSPTGDKYSADHIEIVGDRQNPDYGLFDQYTRISIARRALIEAIKRNSSVVRFGLLRMRQNVPTYGGAPPPAEDATKWVINDSPLVVTGNAAQQAAGDFGGTRWRITRPTVGGNNGAVAGPVAPLVKGDSNVDS